MLRKINLSIQKDGMPRLFVAQEGTWYRGTLMQDRNLSNLLEEAADDYVATARNCTHKAVAMPIDQGKYRVFVFPIQFAHTATMLADYLRAEPNDVNNNLETLLKRAFERFNY